VNILREFKRGIIQENAVFVLLLGMCPTLGVTTSAFNGLGMGIATTAVLICSNLVISMLKSVIPQKVRIPVFIVVIASFVTMVELLMEAYLPDLFKALGIFIPLIVVNCIILGRAEVFASKRGVLPSMLDGLVMGTGFTIALFVLGSVREILGNGAIFNQKFVAEDASTIIFFILPPGAFVALGYLVAIFNRMKRERSETDN